MLRVLATMPQPGMHGLCFTLFVSILLIIFRTSLILSSTYAGQFLVLTHSLVCCSHCCPAIHPKSREPLWPRWESLPNPLIERGEEWNRPGCGGAGAFIPHPYPPTPHPWEGRKPPLHQPSRHCPLIPFRSQLCAVSCLVHGVVVKVPVITIYGLRYSVNTRARAYSFYDIVVSHDLVSLNVGLCIWPVTHW